ncbi:CBO0543 family protein [Neobacillus endophyticus]|uniref:CBO0543 family protein n=1 Tax=Neobacillus endophyticus TaxID=2738405 RepID=UPI0035E415BB
MFNIAVTLTNIYVAWRWGDWRNWRIYHTTILYMIVCDLLYNFLTYNHSLWTYTHTTFQPNHTLINVFVMFIAYPCMVLIYLGRFPKTFIRGILWVLLWVVLWSLFEWISLKLGQFSYQNGWTLGWSIIFNIAIFLMVRLHYSKPLLAYGLSIIATIFMLYIFKVPISKMK